MRERGEEREKGGISNSLNFVLIIKLPLKKNWN